METKKLEQEQKQVHSGQTEELITIVQNFITLSYTLSLEIKNS